MKAALDTNILCYAEGINGPARRDQALNLVQSLPQGAVVLPVQVMGELFTMLVRKAGRSAADARASVQSWRDAFPIIDTTDTILRAATDLAVDHHLGIWDAIILSATAESGCRILLSEDLQDGFT